jgi:general secretion pathway protein N
VRRLAVAAAVAGLLAEPTPGGARPPSHEVSLAAIETESVAPDVNGAAPAEPGSSATGPSTTGNPLWAIPVSKLSATRDRPLFSVSRRPRTPAAPAAPTPTPTLIAQPSAPETPPFTLVGTIIGDDSRIAILYDQTSKIASGVREGERASGWTLRAVDLRSATLEGSGGMVTLELPEPSAQESPAPRISAPGISAPPRKHNLHDNSDGL